MFKIKLVAIALRLLSGHSIGEDDTLRSGNQSEARL